MLKRLASDRFVTGVSFADGELWHGATTTTADQGGGEAELRRISAETGEVLERLVLDRRASGLEADRQGRLWYGEYDTGTLVAVKRSR